MPFIFTVQNTQLLTSIEHLNPITMGTPTGLSRIQFNNIKNTHFILLFYLPPNFREKRL